MTTDPVFAVRHRVRSFLGRWRRRTEGSGIVLAVSGGGDSVALLRASCEVAQDLGLRLSVAHLHHGARAEEADRDAQFVSELADRLGLPMDLGHWRPERLAHFEADARQARYGWLLDIARQRSAEAVAVGHTSDDQAETVLHRIIRGTGVRGLAGIPPRRRLAEGIELIRPLLTTSRDEVRAYLNALGQPWRDDSSNADPNRTRTLIRLEMLPRLATINPKVTEALIRLAQSSRDAAREAERQAAGLARAVVVTVEPFEITLRRDRLAGLPRSVRTEILRIVWRRAGWPERAMSSDRWRRMAALVTRDHGRYAIGAGVDLLLSPDRVRLVPQAPVEAPVIPPASATLPIPGTEVWADWRIVAEIDPGPEVPSDERIDLDAVDPFLDASGAHLVISAPLPGDRFAPLGMGGRSMTLTDFLRGRRIPLADRGRVPVVRDRRGVIWVVGHRIADRVRRTQGTTRLLGLRCEAARR
ncbi:tRNA lysidine(34) synthetase TilS [Tautonia marina]|uniref:tRNA lysidine(34) synthetase TilS n=1 Tax=Tautonia marina TaxID=2653855 RepID=UPI001260933A|nr:tRNA lysidine(34) synthetase TilS [Tautonia marina]